MNEHVKIMQGDCLEVMKDLADNSVDAVVTDPPYGLSFMGKKWDYDVPSQEIWQECLRVLKPGGYLLAFAGTRTQHRMAVRIEDAGFEIRDMIAWVYGSGFPKSLNIGKAVDKLQGIKRELLGIDTRYNEPSGIVGVGQGERTLINRKVTKGTSEWEGWGTALKPALEPITVARKPLSEKTVAENCLKWGTGGINIDGCRVGIREKEQFTGKKNGSINAYGDYFYEKSETPLPQGRFPANIIHDGSDEVVSLFPNKCGDVSDKSKYTGNTYGKVEGGSWFTGNVNLSTKGKEPLGSASRFFYCAKASKSERNKGCEELEEKGIGAKGNGTSNKPSSISEGRNTTYKNNHPTVKPIALMEYLVKLVSREGSVILDPFMGSGSTGVACKNLNRKFIGIERDAEYCTIAEKRINLQTAQTRLQ